MTYVGIETASGDLEKEIVRRVFVEAGVAVEDYPRQLMVDWRDGFWIASNFSSSSTTRPSRRARAAGGHATLAARRRGDLEGVACRRSEQRSPRRCFSCSPRRACLSLRQHNPHEAAATGRPSRPRRNRGPAGGGTAAPSTARNADRRARSAARRGHRRRRDHADLRRPRRRGAVHSIPVRRLGARCSSTRCAKRSASTSASTWRPAPAGRSADRGSATTMQRRARSRTGLDARSRARALADPVRFQQAPCPRAAEPDSRGREIKPGERRPPGPLNSRDGRDVRPLQIADLVEPVTANSNLQALAHRAGQISRAICRPSS